MAGCHDFNPTVQGDHIPAKSITLERVVGGNVVSLAGSTVTLEIVRGGTRIYHTSDNAANGGITINDDVNGVITVQKIDTTPLSPAVYQYVLRVLYADGLRVTFVGGNVPIISKKVKCKV